MNFLMVVRFNREFLVHLILGHGDLKLPLPTFSRNGLLPEGTWKCTGEDFIVRFCKDEPRSHFAKAVQDICDFAVSKGASRIIVGGSFISRKDYPADLDCLIIFDKNSNVPERTERLSVEGVSLDVNFCVESQPEMLGAFVQIFSTARSGEGAGIVEITLWTEEGRPLWGMIQEPDARTLEIVKRAHFGHEIVDKNNNRKVLITVHGIMSNGEWNAEVCHIASSNGWIVAPYVYGNVDARVLLIRQNAQPLSMGLEIT